MTKSLCRFYNRRFRKKGLTLFTPVYIYYDKKIYLINYDKLYDEDNYYIRHYDNFY